MDKRTNYDVIYANSWLDGLQADLKRISDTVTTMQKYPEEWIVDETINEEANQFVDKITNSESFKKFIADPSNDLYNDYRKIFLKTATEQRLLKSVLAGIPLTSTDPSLERGLKVMCCADVKLRKKMLLETKKS